MFNKQTIIIALTCLTIGSILGYYSRLSYDFNTLISTPITVYENETLITPPPTTNETTAGVTNNNTINNNGTTPTIDRNNNQTTKLKIAFGIPVTSGKAKTPVAKSPFWTITLSTLLRSKFSFDKYSFTFFIGYDEGDAVFDSPAAVEEWKTLFKKSIGNLPLDLMVIRLNGTKGAPSWGVCQIMNFAYDMGADYFYQINDDSKVITLNWDDRLVSHLRDNKFISNFGVTGPIDRNNPRIFTHSFIHRTHLDIFHRYFPIGFKNWWSDDWITEVYGSNNSFKQPDVYVQHASLPPRYNVSHAANVLPLEMRKGRNIIKEWIIKNHGSQKAEEWVNTVKKDKFGI